MGLTYRVLRARRGGAVPISLTDHPSARLRRAGYAARDMTTPESLFAYFLPNCDPLARIVIAYKSTSRFRRGIQA